MAQFGNFDQYNANLFLDGMGTTPVLFNQNIIKKSTQTNNFINSGIVTEDATMANQLLAPGEEVILPYSNDLYGEPQAWSDKSDIDVNPITAGQERAVKLRQSQAFGYTDIARLKQMGDPLEVITSGFANYWRRVDETTLLNTLDGVFKNQNIASHNVFDEDKGQSFNPKSFERAVSLLADYQDETFTAIAVHPAVYAEMKANNYLDTVGNDTPLNRAVTPFGTYNGMNVVVDRRLPIDADGTATSYIFGAGAVKYSIATPINAIETYRHPGVKGGQNQIFSKRIYSVRVDGTTVAGGYNPLNNTGYGYADLKNPDMWDLVSDPLRVHVVAYKSKVEPGYASKFFDDEADGEQAAKDAANTDPEVDKTVTKSRKKSSSNSTSTSTSTSSSSK